MPDRSAVKQAVVLFSAVVVPLALVLSAVVLISRRSSVSRADSPPPKAAQPAPAERPLTAAESIQHRFDTQVRPLLAQHCGKCHGNGKSKGEVSLDKFTTLDSVQADEGTWRHLSNLVRQGAMPPEDEPRPSPEQIKLIAEWVDEALAYCDCSGPRVPGRVTIRRLNRTEYNNTVRDLLGVEDFRPADDFPADDSGYGFDNIAEVLTMSPLLAEKYLAAADQVLEKAVPSTNPLKNKARYEAGSMERTGGDGRGGRFASEGAVFTHHEFPAAGEYEVRVSAAGDQAGGEPARVAVRLEGRDVQTFDTVGEDRPQTFAARVRVDGPGRRRVAAAFVNDYYNPGAQDRGERDRNLHVHWLEVEGPLDGPAPAAAGGPYERIFFCTPGKDGMDEEACAAKILERFAARAFRRPAKAEEVQELLKLYRLARGEGEDYIGGVKLALSAALVSPHFLYRVELDPAAANDPGSVRAIGDYELASRLSYFLWSSMPDEELFGLAAAGKLHEPAVLEAQVRRMLADPKSKALVGNFAGQWLELRNLERATRDAGRFPEYEAELRAAMRTEAEMFFETLAREDRSVLEFIDADYTFLNERLARHYGIDGVGGAEFRRVDLSGNAPAVQRRGGVLTMGAVLTVTAMPTRTSPVKRGKFVLEQVLGTPPPPPPPDVPALGEKAADEAGAPLRVRLERHRADPVCASCHERMDAIGFALENFNAVGAWRDADGSFPVDPSGTLPGGEKLDGPESLKRVVLEHKDQFVRCLAEKLMVYALGRGLTRNDRCTVNDVCDGARRKEYKFSALVTAVVTSDAFLKRGGSDTKSTK